MDKKDNKEMITLSREELKGLVSETVDETLIKLGLEPSEVGDMQRDFIFLRQMRETHEQIKNKSLVILLGMVITFTVGALILGLKALLSGAKLPHI